MSPVKPSSSTTGFFQVSPVIPPQYTWSDQDGGSADVKPSTNRASDDVVLARILSLYIPPGEKEPLRTVHDLSRRVLEPELLAHTVDSEVNTPVLSPLNTFGEENTIDPLWTSRGWNALKDICHQEGLVSVAYDPRNLGWNRRVQQLALSHVWVVAGSMTGCPISMTDGAAKLLASHLKDSDGSQLGFSKVVRESYRRLISRDPAEAWTSGQWMTERSGGSDVSGTETIARLLTTKELTEDSMRGRELDGHGLPLGPWRIDGFKWFSSATDSNMTLMLARTENGLSLFYVPTRRMADKKIQTGHGKPVTELNGIRMQRLKNKLGTKSLPTAELELKGVRAWLVGKEGTGIKEISTILNITRLHSAASSIGYWGRGLQICRAYSKVRKVRGILLENNTQHLRWMAAETVKYWAAAHFAFLGHALLGASEQDWDRVVKTTNATDLIPRDRTEQLTLLRLLTPVIKAQTTVAAVHGLRENMECLGGVGYCENNEQGSLFNIARMLRDCLVNPIWEGTVSVMAEDVVRVLTDSRIGSGRVLQVIFTPWVSHVLAGCNAMFSEECAVVQQKLNSLNSLTRDATKDELLFKGRDILEHLETIVCSVLLLHDAKSDRDEEAAEIARRWIRSRTPTDLRRPSDWRHETTMDKRIFLGGGAILREPTVQKL
jgi:alkylation response protein AidB-like acyl-CoA dehydrogenase